MSVSSFQRRELSWAASGSVRARGGWCQLMRWLAATLCVSRFRLINNFILHVSMLHLLIVARGWEFLFFAAVQYHMSFLLFLLLLIANWSSDLANASSALGRCECDFFLCVLLFQSFLLVCYSSFFCTCASQRTWHCLTLIHEFNGKRLHEGIRTGRWYHNRWSVAGAE